MGELLFAHVRVTKIWKISNYIWIYWLENWKKKQNVGLLITSERKYFVLSDFSAVFSSRNLKVLFLKLVNMDTEEPPRMKLNKEDLVSITLDYQAKFNNILDDLKKDISDLKIIYLG